MKSRLPFIIMFVFVAVFGFMALKPLPGMIHRYFNHDMDINNPDTPQDMGDGKTLSFVTYNVLAYPVYEAERVPALLKVLKDSDADIMALVEVSNWFLLYLHNEDWTGKYYWAGPDAEECGGNIILSKYPVEAVTCYPLTGAQARTVLIAKLAVGDRRLSVATSHMESPLEDGKTRGRQLDFIFGKLKGAQDAMLMGDLNFGDHAPEELHIPAAYKDLWTTLRPLENGYTWDNEKSDMDANSPERFPGESSRRLDWMIFRSDVWKPREIHLIGDEPVVKGQKDIFPSDHFGVHGSVTRN